MGACCSSRDNNSRPKASIVAMSAKSRKAIDDKRKKSAEMERFVQETIAKGKPWTDPEFPPERSSLYDPKID